MSVTPYRVHVVVDPHYGERIRSLPRGEPAWIVDSPDNHPIIQTMWQERRNLKEPNGITSFRFDPDAQPEDWFVCELGVIDLHQGEDSHDPSYSVLNVIGTAWSERIQEQLDKYGFFEHEASPQGFITRRDLAA
jgi:hypothetical protein